MHRLLDRQTVLDRLTSPMSDTHRNEEAHPWQVRSFQPLTGPLLRVWDQYSGSCPEKDKRMMSREPEMRLDDRESRWTPLSIHLDYKNWTPTPYISFTTRETRVKSLVAMRRERGAQTLTVIDPNTRLRNGLPIIDVVAEMNYYDIEDPTRKINTTTMINTFVCGRSQQLRLSAIGIGAAYKAIQTGTEILSYPNSRRLPRQRKLEIQQACWPS